MCKSFRRWESAASLNNVSYVIDCIHKIELECTQTHIEKKIDLYHDMSNVMIEYFFF